MTRLHGTWAAAVLVAATLALGACGGDDEGDKSSTGAGTVATTTDTTASTKSGTTTRERTGTTEDRTERTQTRERGDDKGGGGGSGSSGGGSDDSSGSGGGNSGSGSKGEDLTATNTFSTAKTVCRNFLPKALAKDLKDGDKDPADIAKSYSRGFPSDLRKKAYDGCLAGLKARD